jgi:phospholipid/cholesterol/gamma-HCH transport system permease protein
VQAVAGPVELLNSFSRHRGDVQVLERLEELGRFADFAVRTVLAIPATLVRRPLSVLRQFERVMWGSVPLVAIAGISVGLVTWLQTRRILVGYGVEATLPSILTAAVFVETGPMLAALLVAGRMGAGLAAELSSMVLTEEIDARDVLGAQPIPTLVAPRAIACALAVPLLTVVNDASAWVGGLLAEVTAGTLSPQVFGARALDFLQLSDVVPATLKTSIFGLLIGLVGCATGLSADRSTEAVGRAATRGVVRCMLVLFVADVLIVPLIQVFVAAIGWTG